MTTTATATPAKTAKFAYDRPFQIRMLRTLYQDPDYTTSVGINLSPKHFERRAHRWLATKMIDYANKHGHGIGEDALRLTLARDIKTGLLSKVDRDEAVQLIDRLERPVKDKSFIKEELFRFIKNQTISSAIRASLDHLSTHDFEAIDKEFLKVIEVQEAMTGGLGHFFVRDVKTRTKKRREYEKNGISTGTKIDDYLKPGGLPPKTLGVVVAPTGKGKSHILVHLGKSAIIESNAKVLHVTLELSEEAILDRYDAAFSGIPINNLERKPKTVQRAVTDIGAKYGDCLVVKEFAGATLTVPALRAYVRQLERAAFYPDMIIVDYADEMMPTIATRDHNQYEEMGVIYRELRKLAFDLNLPIWTASQTNRDALNKETIDVNSISDSFKKMMIADLVICFCQTLDEKKKRIARLFTAKSRLGQDKFDIKIRVDWSRSTIK
jgi:replicative DNA helicase